MAFFNTEHSFDQMTRLEMLAVVAEEYHSPMEEVFPEVAEENESPADRQFRLEAEAEVSNRLVGPEHLFKDGEPFPIYASAQLHFLRFNPKDILNLAHPRVKWGACRECSCHFAGLDSYQLKAKIDTHEVYVHGGGAPI